MPTLPDPAVSLPRPLPLTACFAAAWAASVAALVASGRLIASDLNIDRPDIMAATGGLLAIVGCMAIAAAALGCTNFLLSRVNGAGCWPRRIVDAGLFVLWSACVAASLCYFSILSLSLLDPGTVEYDAAAQAVVVKGTIGATTPKDFEAVLEAHPDTRLVLLDSPGGWVHGANEIAKAVNAKALTARVQGDCASACVAIWAASPAREMTPKSEIGLHRAAALVRLPDGLSQIAAIPLQVLMRIGGSGYTHWLRYAGFSDAALSRMREVSPDEIWLLGADDLRAAGVKVAVVGGQGRVPLAFTRPRTRN